MSVKFNLYDIKVVCRLCLRFDANSTPIDLEIWNKVFNCFSILLSDKTNYPNKICANCISQLDSCVRFKKQCESSEQNLNDILSNISTKPMIIQPEIIGKNDTGDGGGESQICKSSLSLQNEEIVQLSNPKLQTNINAPQSNGLTHTVYNQSILNVIKESNSLITHYLCELCNITFQSTEDLTNHREINHSNSSNVHKRFQEEIKNDSSFSAEDAEINNRIQKRKKLTRRKTSCPICNQLVSRLKTHMKVVHQTSTYYLQHKCELCSKIFKNAHFLDAHVKKIHETDQTKLCNMCGDIFSNIHLLDIHMKAIHSFQKGLYTCDFCNKTFKRKNLFDYHVRLHDSNLVCNFCSKKFLTKSLLKAHIHVHTGN